MENKDIIQNLNAIADVAQKGGLLTRQDALAITQTIYEVEQKLKELNAKNGIVEEPSQELPQESTTKK